MEASQTTLEFPKKFKVKHHKAYFYPKMNGLICIVLSTKIPNSKHQVKTLLVSLKDTCKGIDVNFEVDASTGLPLVEIQTKMYIRKCMKPLTNNWYRITAPKSLIEKFDTVANLIDGIVTQYSLCESAAFTQDMYKDTRKWTIPSIN